MKKLLLILGAGVMLSACTQSSSLPTVREGAEERAVNQKVGDTTKTGIISQSGTVFFINVIGREPEIIESYSIDLADYVGREVTVKGQYSGDTLFVGQVE